MILRSILTVLSLALKFILLFIFNVFIDLFYVIVIGLVCKLIDWYSFIRSRESFMASENKNRRYLQICKKSTLHSYASLNAYLPSEGFLTILTGLAMIHLLHHFAFFCRSFLFMRVISFLMFVPNSVYSCA
jgi:hypothetical protein